jgi:hypothetical protein
MLTYTFAGYFSLAVALILCLAAIRDRKPVLVERRKARTIYPL